MSFAITRVEGTAQIDALAELYRHLHDAQTAAAPELGPLPARTADASWAHRRRAYEGWLAAPGAFVLYARDGATTLGYALVTFAGPYAGWVSGERVAELKDLSVLPEARGRGIGTRLMDALEAELERMGISEYRLNVIAANAQALRFYERRGLARVSAVFLGRPAPPGT
jgi:ribosomal protein S18 acetylase RimI-like enzyme